MASNVTKWVIGLMSTVEDLKDERTAVFNFLKGEKDEHKEYITPLGYDIEGYPIADRMHPNDVCTTAVDACDIIILLINKQFGSTSHINAEKSVTETEFDRANKNREKIIIPCIHEKAWQEYYKMRKKEMTIGELKYIEDQRVIGFIDRIVNEDNGERYFTKFNSCDDLTRALYDRLRTSVSLTLCKHIVNKQCSTVKSSQTSIKESRSVGEICDKLYVEPIIGENSTKINGTVDNTICESMLNGGKVLLQGTGGAGKSIALAKAYIKYYESYKLYDSFKLPFFIILKEDSFDFKNFGGKTDFDLRRQVNKWLNKWLSKVDFPFLNIDLIAAKSVLFIDGLDEIIDSFSKEQINQISKTAMFNFPLIVAGRASYTPNSLDFVNKFNVKINLKAWKMEKLDEYLHNRYDSSTQHTFTKIKSKLLQIAPDTPDAIYYNPLMLDMLLFLLEENSAGNSDKYQANNVCLFSDFMYTLACREATKRQMDERAIVEIIDFWYSAAWEIYVNRSITRSSPYTINELFCKLTKAINLSDKITTDFLDVIFKVSYNGQISGAYHEQILEYLVANKLFDSCVKGTSIFSYALGEALKPEINRFFREIWKVCRNEVYKSVVCETLVGIAKCSINNSDNDSVFKCLNATYMLGRLVDEKNYVTSLTSIKQLLIEQPRWLWNYHYI
ncbi:MAG: DUF4062 domain-containing protein [Candidatus Bathyarchaeota archaeon]|nr:DUF4062 domain-containing protein [Candidatus Termiticorpusculum sp.]